MLYTSKPLTVEGIQYLGGDIRKENISWINQAIQYNIIEMHDDHLIVNNKDNTKTSVFSGNYIVCGNDGEIKVYEESAFNKLYIDGNISCVSDGYHTFGEYETFRLLYNAAFFNNIANKYNVCKSMKHHNGEDIFGGKYFVVYAELPTGQITNHYELKYWDLFKISEVNKAPSWDGHTTIDVMDRILRFLENTKYEYESPITPWKAVEMINNFHVMRRSSWNKGIVVFRQVPASIQSNIIPNMQSVPEEAKSIIMNTANHIDYKNQLLMYDINTGEANSWNPTASDLMSDDWESFVRF